MSDFTPPNPPDSDQPSGPSSTGSPQPPVPPTGSAAPLEGPDRPGKVDVGDWFRRSWALISPYWLDFVLVFLVFQMVLVVGYLLCLVPALLVIGPLTGGAFVYIGKRVVGQPAEIGDIFKGFRKFGDTLLLAVVLFLIPLAFLAIMFLPGILASMGVTSSSVEIQELSAGLGGLTSCLGCVGTILFVFVYPMIVGTLFVFAYPLVMFKGLGALEALKQSVNLVKPKFFEFLMLLLANVVILMIAQTAGTLLCGIGVLVLGPLANAVIIAMQVYAFKDIVGLEASDLAGYD